MGNVPVIHEVATAAMSLGDLVTGNPEAAGRRWEEYSEQSVVGSGVRAAVAGIAGDNEEATRLARGMGKATGSALCGGGLLSSLPVFHELATAGEALGDMIGYQDDEKARERWKDYSEHSIIGTGSRALGAAVTNDMDEAERLGKNMIVPTLSAATTVVVVAATVASAGAASVAAPIAVGFAGSAIETAAQSAYRGETIDPGSVVGSGILGAAMGGKTGSLRATKLSEGRLYRATPTEFAGELGKGKGLAIPPRQAGVGGETWTSMSTKHTREFITSKVERGQAVSAKEFSTFQIKVPKETLNSIKERSIPQQGSRAANAEFVSKEGRPRNVFNKEHLETHPTKVNIGFKTPNVADLNQSVLKVKEVNPFAWDQSGKGKIIARHWKEPVVSAVRWDDE